MFLFWWFLSNWIPNNCTIESVNEVHKLHLNCTIEHLSPGPVIVQVEESGSYHVAIFPIMEERGIVDATIYSIFRGVVR